MVSVAPRLLATQPVLPDRIARAGTAGHILEAALSLFASRGAAGTSIRDLAAAAGITSSTLYAHFPSKNHVLTALVQAGHEEWFDALQGSLLSSGPEPAEQLAALVHAQVLVHATYPMLAMVVNEELHAVPAELAAPALTLRARAQLLLAEVLQRGIDQGVFDVPHPFVTGAAIAGMGIRVAYWYQPGFELAPDAVADVHATLALRMVGAA